MSILELTLVVLIVALVLWFVEVRRRYLRELRGYEEFKREKMFEVESSSLESLVDRRNRRRGISTDRGGRLRGEEVNE